MILTDRLAGLMPTVRRMAAKGWSSGDIARALSVTPDEVKAILARKPRGRPPGRRPTPPPDPARRIKGPLASKVRDRHELGWTAEAIAEGLALDVEAVRAFLAPRPAPAPRRALPIDPARIEPRQGRPLKRPRSRAEALALSDWPRLDPEPPAPPAAVPELPRVEPAPPAVEPEICPATLDEEWGSWHADQARPGGQNGNAALSDADAARIRRRRAEGVSRADLAREYGCSVATITRITRGDTYRTAAAPEVHDLVSDLPATSPVPGPQGERWDVLPGDRLYWGKD